MANLNLNGQQATVNTIRPYINALKTRLDQRKEIWDKLDVKKRRKWIAGGKDPIITLAYSIYKYLHRNFFSEAYREDD